MKNKCELIGYYGNDYTHALSAWTSTSRNLSEEKINRIPNLLKMLANNGHHTPFEKSTLHFLVTVDQATHIHLLKHRIGVQINGESARYKELKEDKFYIPKDWVNLPLSENALPHKKDRELFGNNWLDVLKNYTEIGNNLYHQALTDLTPVLGRARAKESARFFKTMNNQIDLDISFNWRSFHHFLNLRNKPEAQKEIRELAEQMLQLVKNIPENPFNQTIKAFNL